MPEARKRDPLARCGQAVEHTISHGLEQWGLIVARHTWKVFMFSIIFALICISGVMRLKSETETENLWTPRGAPVKDDKKVYDANFGTGFRGETIFFKMKDGSNILTKDAFMEIYEFDTKYRRDMQVTVEGTAYNFASVCAKARPTDTFCLAGGSPLEFTYNIVTHRFDFSNINSDADLLNLINRASIDFTPEGSKETFSLDISNRHDLMANVVRNADSGRIETATTLKMSWFASRANDTVRDESCTGLDSTGAAWDEVSCNPTEVWENEFEKRVNEEFNVNSKHVFAHVQTASSIGNELSKVIGGDVITLNVGLFLIVLYAILVLGKFHPVLSRSSLAFSGVVSVGLAIGGTFGIGGWTGVPQTPVTSTLPFILLGIGVDDMFVLAGALGRAPTSLSAEDRIGYMMRTAGTSIFITTLTDMLAFALSTTTSFPALAYFCTWAVYGILLDFIFQITFFLCACVWDEQRVKSRARDCYCCAFCCAKPFDPETRKGGCCDCCFMEPAIMEQKGCTNPCCCLTCQKDGGYLANWLKDYYAPFLVKKPVKAAVIVIFFGILGMGAYGSTQLTENFSLRFFVPSDSPLNVVFDIQDKEYRTGDIGVSVLLDHTKEGHYLHQPTVRADGPRIATGMQEFAYFQSGSLVDPLNNFTQYIFEAADGFPMSPHHFWTAEKASFDWYARTATIGEWTVYPDLEAEDRTIGTEVTQGGISAGTWPRLRTATYMEGIPADGKFSRGAYIKDTKLFYDVLAHFVTTPQGAGMRSYFAPHEWYEGFTDWIESLPEENWAAPDGSFTIDKRRDVARGMYNDVHNGTARPKHPAKFCSALKYFLSTNETLKAMLNPPLDEADPNCYPKQGDYKMTRIGVSMKCRVDEGVCPLSNSTAEVEIMQGSRDVVADLNSDLGPRAYSFSWLFAEQYAVVRREALSSIFQAIIAVGVVTMIFISHWFTGLIVVANIAMVLFDIVGVMWLWDISINSISIIYLVLAIGLAVDYSAHIAHAFMSHTGTNDERVMKAISEMGADVSHGAMSTFLAVVVMSTSKSYIFTLFFRQFFAICLFGFGHGMIFLPVVLSLIGPASSADHEEMTREMEDANAMKEVVMEGKPAAVQNDTAPDTVNSQAAYSAPNLDAPDLAAGSPIGATATVPAEQPV
mmetsp:Transcript_9528/g.18486  ORF Transcript_9528/g.18486 Transcript_9528/m.18486 type:complete len:1147 (+) Transcript_9528:168-3608(+)